MRTERQRQRTPRSLGLPTGLLRTIAALLVSVPLQASAQPAGNQGLIVRDGSLGEGPLDVAPGLDPLGRPADYLIGPELGEQVGGNLFHSFSDFGIGTGETATFTGPDPIDAPQSVNNIISRVTGGAASNIDGTLRSTIPGADVYLLNPAGLLFGENAQLDVQGSFYGTTADRLEFADGQEFDARRDDAVPVLSVAPVAAFGFLDGTGGAHGALLTVEGDLVVGRGSALYLVGEGIAIDGGTLRAPNGQVVLASVASPGAARLDELGASGPAHLAGFAELGPIELVRGATVDASGTQPGSVKLSGARIDIVGPDSAVFAENQGEGRGGQIAVAARNSVSISGENTGLTVSANEGSRGDAGAVLIESPQGTVALDNGVVTADTYGGSNGGLVHIGADLVTLGNGSAIQTSSLAEGSAGSIQLDVGTLILNQSGVYAGARGKGDAGSIRIDATGGVYLLGNPEAGEFSIISVDNLGQPESMGQHGSIHITAAELKMQGDGRIQGIADNILSPAGSVVIHVTGDLEISGRSRIATEGIGRASAGDIDLRAGTLSISGGGSVLASSQNGDAGTITIDASNSVSISSQTAGTINVVELLFSQLSNRDPLGVSFVGSGSLGSGGGGSVTISAPNVTLEDPSLVFTATLLGRAGPITIDAEHVLRIADGALVETGSFGTAGSIHLTAGSRVEVIGADSAGIPSRVRSSTAGAGAAGPIIIEAPEIVIDGGAVAAISLFRATGAGGSIELRGGEVIVTRGGRVDASTFTGGQGGSIEIVASQSLLIEGEDSGLFTLAASDGDGGDILVTTPRLEIREGGVISGASRPGTAELARVYQDFSDSTVFKFFATLPDVATGDAGDILVRAGNVQLIGGALDANAPGADGGNITIETSNVIDLSGASISANVGGGTGGNISMSSGAMILADGSRIVARAGHGRGGDITIVTDALFTDRPPARTLPNGDFTDGSNLISAEADDPSLSGQVEVRSPDVTLVGSLAQLPEAPLDASSVMRQRCSARRGGETAGSFTVAGRSGAPPSPDGLLPAALPFRGMP